MYSVDTNNFLEMLTKQDKSEICKSFLDKNRTVLYISDLRLHSIGVVLFRQNEGQSYLQFFTDTLPRTSLISLPKYNCNVVIETKNKFDLDSDDSYQYSLCKHFDLSLVTMDQDVMKILDQRIEFL